MKMTLKHLFLGAAFGAWLVPAVQSAPWGVVPATTSQALNGIARNATRIVGDSGTVLGPSSICYPLQGFGCASTFAPEASSTVQNLQAVDCANDCFAVGDSGVILHRAGQGWTTTPSGTRLGLRSVSLHGDSVFVAGDSGTVLKRRGVEWIRLPTGVTLDIHYLRFQYNTGAGANPYGYDTGFAVGKGGLILKSTNRGTSWTALASGTTRTLFAGYFGDNSGVGLVVGDSGTILRTLNRGVTWTSIPSGTTSALLSVDFVSAAEGFIVGASGIVLETSDAGLTWQAVTPAIPRDLHAVSVNGQNAFVIGTEGAILVTRPSGTSITRKGPPPLPDSDGRRAFDPLGRRLEEIPEGIRRPATPVLSPK